MPRGGLARPALPALLLAGLALGCGQSEVAPLAGWSSDYEAARAEAAKSNRPLAVLFTAPWSGLARRFERNALRDPRVEKELARFVRVRVTLEAQPQLRDENGVTGVPALLFVSPQKEKKVLRGSCSAPELAEFLGTLGDWKPLDGWESDPAKAREGAGGKPLATLYSAAWEAPARAFEREPLADPAAKGKLAGFALLRLNFEENRASAKAAGVKAAPALVLPAGAGGSAAVTETCPGALLAGFIDSLAAWPPPPGWTTDYEAALAEARAGGKPLAILLARPSHWPSYKFAAAVLQEPAVARELAPFVKVRLDHGKAPRQLVDELQVSEVPCLVVRDLVAGDAAFRTQGIYVPKDDSGELVRRLAAELGKIAGASAKPPPAKKPTGD